MARTIEEIMEYLNDSEKIKKDFEYITFRMGIQYIRCYTDVRSVDDATINEGENQIPELIANARMDAKKILYELDRDFKDALSSVGEEQRESLKAEYEKKRQLVADGVEMIETYGDKTKENWERFKRGELISYEDLYGVYDSWKNKTKDVGERSDDASKGVDESAALDDESGDLSVDEQKTVLQLMRELREAREQRRKAERALSKQRFKEFKQGIEESGSAYLQAKGVEEKYKARIKELKEMYNQRKFEIDREESDNEDRVDTARANLGDLKGKLRDARKNPVVQHLENAVKARKKLQQKLAKTTDESEKTVLEDKIKNAEATISRCIATPEGKQYTQIKGEIGKNNKIIENGKGECQRIANLRAELDNYFKTETDKAKKNKENNLPAKQSKFKMFIGAIRAKLGIGKYKSEKNAKDWVHNAIQGADNFLIKAEHFVSSKYRGAKESVKSFASEKANQAIEALQQHINNRIAAEKGKTAEIQQKMQAQNEGR